MQRGETEHQHNALRICRQPTLFSSVTYAFRANQSFRPSSPKSMWKNLEMHGTLVPMQGGKSPVLGSLLTRLTLNKGWREHFSESSRCLKLLMATYLLNFKPLSSMLCAHGIKLRRDMAIHTIHSTKTEQILWLVKGYIIDCALKKLLSPSSRDKKHKQVILIQCQRHCVLQKDLFPGCYGQIEKDRAAQSGWASWRSQSL